MTARDYAVANASLIVLVVALWCYGFDFSMDRMERYVATCKQQDHSGRCKEIGWHGKATFQAVRGSDVVTAVMPGGSLVALRDCAVLDDDRWECSGGSAAANGEVTAAILAVAFIERSSYLACRYMKSCDAAIDRVSVFR